MLLSSSVSTFTCVDVVEKKGKGYGAREGTELAEK
jgi:hypothetical protein